MSALIPLLLVLSLLAGGHAEAVQSNPCAVAREIETKAIALLDSKPDDALKAFQNAYATCPNDVVIGFNLGLALHQTGKKQQAMELWEKLHEEFPDHVKTMANLAWVKFELGDDRRAHLLATEGFAKQPGNLALAHTKLFALFRRGHYLEAYDWIARMIAKEREEPGSGLKGERVDLWRDMAAGFVTETLWRQFRQGERMEALRQSINLLVKEYPGETAFVRTKDQLVLAYTDPEAEIPFPRALPHESWAKNGDVDDQSAMLDARIQALPALAEWQKRSDAYAVVAGISHYKRIRARHFADRDATHVHRLLTKRGLFIDNTDHVRLRINNAADHVTLRQDLEWLIKQGQNNPNATLLFFFSGLGLSTGPDALLLPANIQLGNLNADHAISLSWLQSALARLPNKDTVVLLDVCFNNTQECAIQNGQTAPAAPRGILLQGKPTAIAADKLGGALHGPAQQGAFTWHLLKAMLGDADGFPVGKKDGWVDLTEAFAQLRVGLARHTPAADPIFSVPTQMRLTRTGGEQ
ncbi:MAG: tetratricopeptide repeat protein [Magnetococcales bacterium]|nr:tetratricopeptide repeat protein [Magnetococcales bacterium]